MTYSVIQWATGVIGTEAAIGVVGHKDLELVGAWVSSDAKEGRDVGEILGIGPLGFTATQDRDALLASAADCVSYMPARSWAVNPMDSFGELLAILRSGKNVVSLWWPTLIYPKAVSDEVYDALQQACLDGGSSFYSQGLDPGYGSAGLAIAALEISRGVKTVNTFEFFNNGSWEGPDVAMFFGFGKEHVDETPILFPGVTASYHATTLHLIAAAMGEEIEEIVEEHSVGYADETFDVPAGHIAKGTISMVNYQVKGLIGGEPRYILNHIETLRDEDFPAKGFPGSGYRVEVEGDANVSLELVIDAPGTPRGVYDGVAIVTAMSVVNAIPAVCDAPPGVLSLKDLRRFASKNLRAL